MGTIIRPVDHADARRLALRLLAAAGVARHAEVRTVSEGPLGVAFDVPDDLAVEVLGAVRADGGEEPVSEPVADGDDALALTPAAGAPDVAPVADVVSQGGRASRRSRR